MFVSIHTEQVNLYAPLAFIIGIPIFWLYMKRKVNGKPKRTDIACFYVVSALLVLLAYGGIVNRLNINTALSSNCTISNCHVYEGKVTKHEYYEGMKGRESVKFQIGRHKFDINPGGVPSGYLRVDEFRDKIIPGRVVRVYVYKDKIIKIFKEVD